MELTDLLTDVIATVPAEQLIQVPHQMYACLLEFLQ